jgi:hypothetical protein
MSKPNDGGPAFPGRVRVFSADGSFMGEQPEEGMSLRAWLAGMAMQGMLACPDQPESRSEMIKAAVINADMLIAELEKDA